MLMQSVLSLVTRLQSSSPLTGLQVLLTMTGIRIPDLDRFILCP
jgi:hypothetical protein